MKRHELDAALKKGNHPNALMLYGESHFLIDRYAKFLCTIEDANLLGLYHDEYDKELAKAHLSQGSLFGGRNVLLIKSEKKLPKADLDLLIALSQKNPDTLFVYAYYGDDYKTSNKAFDKRSGGDSIRLFNPFPNEAISIIMEEGVRRRTQIEPSAAKHLLESQHGDLALACNELDKLAVLNRPITTKEIEAHVYGLAEVKLEDFIRLIIVKRDFRDDLHHLLESGEDEVRIVTAISTFIAQLYLFHIYIKLHGIPDSLAVLGYKLPPDVEKKRAELSIKLKPKHYQESLIHLLHSELLLKSGSQTDKTSLLLSTLLRLQAIL
ncbi:MAG: DNA polymerase III subunit delta [Campylobacterales bacterium]|nr:DNA polymerase III subunit delta [Campylobacterales bacterium]